MTAPRPDPRFALWRAVAEQRGGEVYEPSALRPRRYAIDVEVGRAAVLVTSLPAAEPGNGVAYAAATLLVPAGPSFSAAPRALAAADRRVRLGVEVRTGDAGFDELFMVTSKDPGRTRRLLSARATGLMASWFGGATVGCDGRVVVLEGAGELGDGPSLEAALELVAEVASGDVFGLGALEGLPGADLVPAEGPWNDRSLPYVAVEAAATARAAIGPVVDERGEAVTRVELDEARAEGSARVEVTGAGLTGDLEALPASALPSLRRVGAGTLRVEPGWVCFTWRRVVEERAPLLAGIELVGSFARATRTARRGAYR